MKKKVLIIGQGGREQAFAWKMAESPLVQEVALCPDPKTPFSSEKIKGIGGNLSDFDNLLRVAKTFGPDLIIVGPEGPLANGLTDWFLESGFEVLGPDQKSAQLESSKSFSKDLMREFGIPTANYKVYDSFDKATLGLDEWDWKKGVAIKADKLAGGKGVFLCFSREEGENTIYKLMKDPLFSVKDEKLVFEEYLQGKEISAFCLCDGEDFITLGFARDYKRLKEGDKGPNTGGMGGMSLDLSQEKELKAYIEENVFRKTLSAMKLKGTPFKGILFAGLMIEPGDSVKVLEFNVRMGDPETQILFPLFNEDLYPLFESAANGGLGHLRKERPLKYRNQVHLKSKNSVHIVMASKGYPVLEKNRPMLLNCPITYPKVGSSKEFIFFSGAQKNEGSLVNTGGRVLGVTCLGDDLSLARESAYNLVNKITFEGAQWRKDMAHL